ISYSCRCSRFGGLEPRRPEMVTHTSDQGFDVPIFLASADGHVGISTKNYGAYLERDYQPAFEEFLIRHKYRWTPERPESMFRADLRQRHLDYPRFEEHGLDVLHDPVQRLVQLDADGVA